MKNFRYLVLFFTIHLCLLNATEFVISSDHQEGILIGVESKSFREVMNEIQDYLDDEMSDRDCSPDENVDLNQLSFSYMRGSSEIFVSRSKQKAARNYAIPASSEDKDNLRYVIRSLARFNLAQLAKEKSSLERAGDRLNHLHPFRFLQCIFTDEELKAGIHAIRKKGGYVWDNYYGGLKDSLNEEFNRNNLVQFTPDFANCVGVNVNDILPYVQNRQWSTLMDVLINTIPRQGNPERYDL